MFCRSTTHTTKYVGVLLGTAAGTLYSLALQQQQQQVKRWQELMV
jgi:hypothetical protein